MVINQVKLKLWQYSCHSGGLIFVHSGKGLMQPVVGVNKMQFLDNTRMGGKLIGGFLILALIVAVIGVFGWVNLKSIDDGMTSLYADRALPLEQLGNADADFQNIRADIMKYELVPAARSNLKAEITNLTASVNKNLGDYKATYLLDTEQAQLKNLELTWTAYQGDVQQFLGLVDSGKDKEAIAMLDDTSAFTAHKIAYAAAINELEKINQVEAERISKEGAANFAQSTIAIIISIILGIALAVALGVIISRSITIPLGKGVSMMQEIGLGHLGSRLKLGRKDEIGQLTDAMDSFSDDLQNIVVAGMKKISMGDLSLSVTSKDDRDEIAPALSNTLTSLTYVVNELQNLSARASEGELSVRGDAGTLQGSYHDIILGFNTTLEAFIGPLTEAIRLSEEYSRCNFKAIFSENISVKGDFIAFRDALNAIGIEVSRALSIVNTQMTQLSEQAVHVYSGVEDIKRGATAIAQDADKTSHNVERSEEGIAQVLKAMEDLTTTVSSVSANVEAVARSGTEADHLAKDGIKHAAQAKEGMESIRKTSQETEVIIAEIRDQMSEIAKIIGIITSISDQTNLLALNAAIEAARAGDAGLGFAVVADEVKSLANQTGNSANQITSMIEGLDKKSQAAVAAISEANRAVIEGSEAVHKTLDVFTQLTSAVGAISSNMESVAGASEEQAASFEEITASVQEMSNLVKQTAQDALNSSAAAEEALTVVNQITHIVDEIEIVVKATNQEMKRFTIQ